MNYTVFDVETANSQRASICSIGVLRYEDGQIVFEKEFLINPEVQFDFFNTRIHGIKASDVENEPTFPQVWKEIKEYFDNTILVAHNAKSMDLCALYKTLEKYGLSIVNNQYICTLELAKEIFKNDDSVQSYKLNVLSNKYHIKLENHHRALDDTRACFELLRKFEELYPQKVVPQQYAYINNTKSSHCCSNFMDKLFSDKTKVMQKLQKIVMEIIDDREISDDEVRELKAWLEEHKELKGYYPFDKIFEVVEDTLLDGVMDQDEQLILLEILDAFINPKTEKKELDFTNKNVCLSGDFNFGSKKQVEDYLCSKGAIIAKSVTGKLDILILGEAGSAAWKYGNYGSKYEKACQLNEKGKNIAIVKESNVSILEH